MSMSATYSPEDNKLRLYAMSRLDSETYARVKAEGFKWAPKQELFVAPGWTPSREDLLLELCEEIGDEDYSPEERSADRAERFSGYRDKRRDEAGGFADRFDAGPEAFGHQNRDRAERQAARHDRIRGYAGSQWSKAEYWQTRTAGVIGHALHKSCPQVRRRRLLRLEAELRKHLANVAEAKAKWEKWKKVAAEPDADKATLMAKYLVGNFHFWGDYKHPRKDKESTLSSLLEPYGDPESPDYDPITGHEAAAMFLAKCHEDGPGWEGGYSDRWTKHLELRTEYEKAMLANEGGMAAEVDMEPGGWLGKFQIHRVFRSPATGRVVSVYLMGEKDYYRGDPVLRPDGSYGTPLVLKRLNIERFGEGVYRAPTDEERVAFASDTKDRKAKEKASKPAAPKLFNPTDEDAERLQALWNVAGKAKHDEKNGKYSTYKPSGILRMTQAEYSQRSKGTYAHCETRTLHECGKPSRRSSNMYTSEGSNYDKSLGKCLGKIRVRSSGDWYAPPHVIVITDKPQKALPLDWTAIETGPEVLVEA